MKEKFIKVDDKTHKLLKMGAANSELSMKAFICKMADKNINGIPFDVDKHSIADLLAVLGNIFIAIERREEAMTKDEAREFVCLVDNVAFSE